MAAAPPYTQITQTQTSSYAQIPAERVFSTAGLIVNRLRTRLSPEHVDMLIFLNKNEYWIAAFCA